MAYFTFENNKVHYEIIGKGRPLLLVHGNTASSRMFDEVIEKYTSHFKVILIDFPGHGKSDRLEQFNVDYWYFNALVCNALIDKLNLRDVTVIGTSGGALVALNLGLEFPEKIDFIVADSFEGEFPLSSYIEVLEADRKESKENEFSLQFWSYCHGDDWEKIVDLDTQVNLEFAKEGKSFFHKSISDLQVPALLTGSMQDEYCQDLDRIYSDLKKKNQILGVHFFKYGNHPAMLSNKEDFFTIFMKHLEQHNRPV